MKKERELELVQKAKKGDPDAFASLYETIYQDLYRFACYTLRNTYDAEDVVSETVMDAFAAIRRLRKEESFKSWMFRILSNKCKNKIREYQKKEVNWEELEETVLPKQGYGRGKDGQKQIIEPISVGEERKIEEQIYLKWLFHQLEDQDRMILCLHIFGGYKDREIAQMLRMNANTVRTRERRALKRLSITIQEAEVYYG